MPGSSEITALVSDFILLLTNAIRLPDRFVTRDTKQPFRGCFMLITGSSSMGRYISRES